MPGSSNEPAFGSGTLRSRNGNIGYGGCRCSRSPGKRNCPLRLDAIIVCTVTPDMQFPSTACLVQDRLGAKDAWGFDLVAACSGFLYGLT